MIVQGNPLITWGVALLLAIGIGCCVDANPWKHRDLHSPLIVTTQCNANGSLTLEFPSEVVGKLIMYFEELTMNSIVYYGERLVSERRQLLEPEYQNSDLISPHPDPYYSIRIFEHGDESGNKIVLRQDDMPRHYDGTIKCYDNEWHMMQFENSSLQQVDYDDLKFMIGDTRFYPIITYANKKKGYGHLGDKVKMEIEIEDQDRNLFGKKSYLKSCNLDIPYLDGNFESIPILDNSYLTPEGSAIEFRAKYTPSRRYYNNRGYKRGYRRRYKRGYKPAKYTVEFKTFVLRNWKQFNFNCQATSY